MESLRSETDTGWRVEAWQCVLWTSVPDAYFILYEKTSAGQPATL